MKKKTDKNPLSDEILEHYKEHPGAPRKPRRLAKQMGIDADDYPHFRQTFKKLRDAGLLSNKKGDEAIIAGRFIGKDRGFGFVKPDEPGQVDLYIPAGSTGGAMNGDQVAARVTNRRVVDGVEKLEGAILRVLERANYVVAGVVESTGGSWFLEPDGDTFMTPILIDPLPPGGLHPGHKAVVEIVEFPQEAGMMPVGSVKVVLGEAGRLETETQAIIHASGLRQEFGEDVLAEARRSVENYSQRIESSEERRDLTDLTVVTIDPEDARDFDDAISLAYDQGNVVLGVHIADVSHVVPEDSALDLEARERATSVYFPRLVVPMLPPGLSQGVCALKEDQPRFTKSVFITYDKEGDVIEREVTDAVIRSSRRLTYEQAQRIVDNDAEIADDVEPEVAALVRDMDRFAHTIANRRRRQGMLSLDLPEAKLVLDDRGRVVDVEPEEHIFSHKVIEMFMIEANEAVATLLTKAGAPVMRRGHPTPTDEAYGLLRGVSEGFGHSLPKERPSRQKLQKLIDRLHNKPEGYAINLAMLRSLQRASYTMEEEGHYALASENYCHFTSPIRRYPDLVVHRLVERVLIQGGKVKTEELEQLKEIAKHCSEQERVAEDAEHELRQVLLLQHLEDRQGSTFDGVVTAATSFGVFVQLRRYLIEGLLRRDDLDRNGWWELADDNNALVDQNSGTTVRVGDVLRVTIATVDVAQRHLDLTLAEPLEPPKKQSRKKKRKS